MAAELTTTTLTVPDGTEDEVLQITGSSANSYRLAGLAITTGDTYTFSVWTKTAAATTVEFRVLGNLFTSNVTTAWQKVVFTVDEASTDYIDISPASDSVLYLYKGMLQKGQFDTDWKPAPEDTESALAEVQEKASRKNTVYYSAAQPTGDLAVGDIWFSTGDGGIYVYNGSTWAAHQVGTVSIQDGALTADAVIASGVFAREITATNMKITGDSTFDGRLNVGNLVLINGKLGAFSNLPELDEGSYIRNLSVSGGDLTFNDDGSLDVKTENDSAVISFAVNLNSISDSEITCNYSGGELHEDGTGEDHLVGTVCLSVCVYHSNANGDKLTKIGQFNSSGPNTDKLTFTVNDSGYILVEISVIENCLISDLNISFENASGEISTKNILTQYGSALAINATNPDSRINNAKKAVYLGANGISQADEDGNTGSMIDGKFSSNGTQLNYGPGDTISSYCIAAGFLTSSQTGLNFLLPTPPVCGDVVSMNSLSLLLRHADGGYPYARSGSSGGTYTQLGSSQVEVWSNGASVRTNEISSITCTPVVGGIRVVVNFTYALAKASGSTTAVTNNVPMAVVCTYNVSVS